MAVVRSTHTAHGLACAWCPAAVHAHRQFVPAWAHVCGQFHGHVYEDMAHSAPPTPAHHDYDAVVSSAEAPAHLKLGITEAGFYAMLELIGFPFQWADKVKTAAAKGSCETPHPDNLTHSRSTDAWVTYTRPQALAWVTDAHGPFCPGQPVGGKDAMGRRWSAITSSSTGYDVVQAVRDYLTRTGNQGKSLCEVLAAENSPHVGPATVFLSHVQASHVAASLGTLRAAPGLFDACSPTTKYWIDFFSLRQCQDNAFVPEQIVGVIKSMDACLIEIDRPNTYLRRTFCIFEAFAAVLAGVNLLCAPKVIMEETRDQERWENVLLLARKVEAVDCANADSRNKQHAAAINQYIKRTVGFDVLNEAVKHAILLGMDRTRPGAPGIKTVDASVFFDVRRMAKQANEVKIWAGIVENLGQRAMTTSKNKCGRLLEPLMQSAGQVYEALQIYQECRVQASGGAAKPPPLPVRGGPSGTVAPGCCRATPQRAEWCAASTRRMSLQHMPFARLRAHVCGTHTARLLPTPETRPVQVA